MLTDPFPETLHRRMPENIHIAAPAIQDLKKGDMIIVETESLSGEGTSVGRWGGIVCFVEHAVPGDVARVKLFKIKKQYLAGRAVEILEDRKSTRLNSSHGYIS